MTTVQKRQGGDRSSPHSDLARGVQDYLLLRGAWVFRVHGHLGQQPGISDILACIAGRMVAVEIKTGGGRLSRNQWRQREALEAAGGLFIECRSLDMLEETLLAAGLITERAIVGGAR